MYFWIEIHENITKKADRMMDMNKFESQKIN